MPTSDRCSVHRIRAYIGAPLRQRFETHSPEGAWENNQKESAVSAFYNFPAALPIYHGYPIYVSFIDILRFIDGETFIGAIFAYGFFFPLCALLILPYPETILPWMAAQYRGANRDASRSVDITAGALHRFGKARKAPPARRRGTLVFIVTSLFDFFNAAFALFLLVVANKAPEGAKLLRGGADRSGARCHGELTAP